MIDFSKLNTPEAREEMKRNREARDTAQKKKDEAIKFQLDYLLNELDELNSYEQEFVQSVSGRFNAGIPLSEKQEAVLEKIFNT